MSMPPQELKRNLNQFTGTENYHRFSPLFRNTVLTDGALYLAEKAGAFWLMDMIASYLPGYKDVFASAKLIRSGEGGRFTLDDGNGSIFCTQDIEYSDFCLDEIMLFVAKQEGLWVIMLPSEY